MGALHKSSLMYISNMLNAHWSAEHNATTALVINNARNLKLYVYIYIIYYIVLLWIKVLCSICSGLHFKVTEQDKSIF